MMAMFSKTSLYAQQVEGRNTEKMRKLREERAKALANLIKIQPILVMRAAVIKWRDQLIPKIIPFPFSMGR